MTRTRLQSHVAILLCVLLMFSSNRAFCDAADSTQVVGKVTALRSGVTQNGTAVSLNDVIRAKQAVKTDDSGRVSVELQDGSKLWMGSQTELTILGYDRAAGKTLINLSNGKMRSRAGKLPAGAFVITTAQGTITALGTDFSVDVSAAATHVIVYSGVLLVHSSSASTDLSGPLVLDVSAGQDVLIDDGGIRTLQLTPNSIEQQSMAETIVPETGVSETSGRLAESQPPPVVNKPSHTLRNILIGGLAAGAIVGAIVGLRGGSKSTTSSGTPSVPTIPAQ
jgi:hypothetical protein